MPRLYCEINDVKKAYADFGITFPKSIHCKNDMT